MDEAGLSGIGLSVDLPWYPDKPLRNSTAWALVACVVAILLASRVFIREPWPYSQIKPLMLPPQQIASPISVESRIKLYLRGWSILLSLTVLWRLVDHGLDFSAYFSPGTTVFDTRRWIEFTIDKGEIVLLSLMFFYIFFLTTAETSNSFQMMQSAFDVFKRPQQWRNIVGPRIVPALGAAYFVLFLFWAWKINDVRIFAASLTIFSLLNVVGHSYRRSNVLQYFCIEAFSPLPGLERPFICKRREIILASMAERHGLRDSGVAALAFIGLCLTIWPTGITPRLSAALPYLVLTLTVVANEFVVYRSRRRRTNALAAVEAQQIRVGQDFTLETKPHANQSQGCSLLT